MKKTPGQPVNYFNKSVNTGLPTRKNSSSSSSPSPSTLYNIVGIHECNPDEAILLGKLDAAFCYHLNSENFPGTTLMSGVVSQYNFDKSVIVFPNTIVYLLKWNDRKPPPLPLPHPTTTEYHHPSLMESGVTEINCKTLHDFCVRNETTFALGGISIIPSGFKFHINRQKFDMTKKALLPLNDSSDEKGVGDGDESSIVALDLNARRWSSNKKQQPRTSIAFVR